MNKLNNTNLDHMKISKTHRGSHKMPSRATCGPRVGDPALEPHLINSEASHMFVKIKQTCTKGSPSTNLMGGQSTIETLQTICNVK